MFNVIYTENIQKKTAKFAKMVSIFSCLFFNHGLTEIASPLGQNQAMKNENLIKALCETTEKCKALKVPFTRMQ